MLTFNARLRAGNQAADSLVCVGLDPDLARLPEKLPRDLDGLRYFLDSIIATTSQWACAYKPNWAFFLALGTPGCELLGSLRDRVPADRMLIGDGKWGDIGNSVDFYAKARDAFGLDGVTATPYMGWEAIEGLRANPRKGVFVLCRSSNRSGDQVQLVGPVDDPLYLQIARRTEAGNRADNCGLVLGANDSQALARAHRLAPSTSTLVPGIGAQGGDLEATLAALSASGVRAGAAINAGRSVIYADSGPGFAKAAGAAAKSLCEQINAAIVDL